MTTEKRQFRLDNHAISMLIQAQAGSLQKAILEAVANALDAGASKVKVDLSAERVVIQDDGRGFQGEEELEKFFETFGFDHSQLDRKVGRFGVGRGQLFHFGKNLWTTHGFTMAVDTKKDMFGYELGRAAKPHKGVKIEIDLYSPLAFSELSSVEAELKKLTRFSTIPVILNGKQVQKNPEKMEWDAETDFAWFKFDDGYDLKVYSQGLYVQSLSSREFGRGGIVVTKLGHPLKQNMARNDMLVTDCDVWKATRAKLTELARTLKKDARTKKTMNESMRASVAIEAIASNDLGGLESFLETPLFTLTNGKHVRLRALLAAGFVASAPNKDPAADLLLQRKQAVVVNPQTLHRFQVDSVEGLCEKIKAALQRYLAMASSPQYSHELWEARRQVQDMQRALTGTVFKEKVSDLPMKADIDIIEVKDSEASKEEKMALVAIRRAMMPSLTVRVLNQMRDPSEPEASWWDRTLPIRKVSLAVLPSALACTDGATKIWVDRKFLSECVQAGPRGFTRLANVLTHEIIHDVDSTTGHDHDIDFYEAFHEVTSDGAVAEVGLYAYRKWLRSGGKALVYGIREMEGAGLLDSADANARQAALSGTTPADALLEQELAAPEVAVAAAPVPRRSKKMKP